MQVQKKQILKDDGRVLTFYHFAATADPEQRAVFDNVAAPVVEVGMQAGAESSPGPDAEEASTVAPPPAATQSNSEEPAHV